VKIVILGLSVTSSWGNGHATTYRSLIRGLHARGHEILFLERDAPWYAGNRDQPGMAEATIEIYSSFETLVSGFESQVRAADLVIAGSFVPDGIAVGEWLLDSARGITAFYDIDTPITLDRLGNQTADYISPDLVRRYDMYLSFTGGPTLRHIESRFGAPMARALYCSVDPRFYYPEARRFRWDLGYLGTYSNDRQPVVDRLLMEPARQWPEGRFAVAGPAYPENIHWPQNVSRIFHLEPKLHRSFYTFQRYTLNVTRELMVRAGYSPSVRLFEAAACGVPIISDYWEGLDSIFEPGKEILVSQSADDTLRYLRDTSDEERRAVGQGARARVLAEHTFLHRAAQIEAYYEEVRRNHDQVLVDSTRGNGHGRKHHHRAAAGSASERDGAAAGGTAGLAAETGAAHGDLRQPAGTRPGNRRTSCAGETIDHPYVRGGH